MADIAEQFDSGGWEFTPDVVAVFPEHVRASVPFYDQIQLMVAELADWFLPEGGVYADLGASTGETCSTILQRQRGRQFTSYLYDEQAAMLDRAKATLNPVAGGRIHYFAQQIQQPLQHDNADLTTCLFTLQFLPWTARFEAMKLARQHARDDSGVLLVAEKVRPVDSRWAEVANDRSHDWKAEHGIDDSAIRAKARALRGVLTPYPVAQLGNLIAAAGWSPPETLFTWHSWVVLGAFAI